MILLYADDPGGANFLAPLPAALAGTGLPSRFVVDPALAAYARDRAMLAIDRKMDATPEQLLAGVSLLVVGTSENPDCFGHQLTAGARRLGIPSLGVIDMEVNAGRRFRGASDMPLTHAPDALAVPDAGTRDAFAGLGFPASQIYVCGHPHFDRVRERRIEFLAQDRDQLRRQCFPGAPADRPVWLFVAEGVDQLNPSASFRSERYTLAGRGDTDFRAAIVLEEVLDAARDLSPRPWIVLRLHPKSRLEDFDVCRAEIDAVSTGGDPLPLVWAADLVIGMTSMLLFEAGLLGRPHVAVVPRVEERHWLPALAAVLTPSVSTREQLSAFLAAPPSGAGDAAVPDHSTERVVQAVVHCLSQRRATCSPP
ncbi:MAG: hypothetical protein WC815_07920 [Vicinamibacterales bacterium]|jgi:hypothetical protein